MPIKYILNRSFLNWIIEKYHKICYNIVLLYGSIVFDITALWFVDLAIPDGAALNEKGLY
jgi:hypothetical protein